MSLLIPILELFIATVNLLVREEKLEPALKWILAFFVVMRCLVRTLPSGQFQPKSQ